MNLNDTAKPVVPEFSRIKRLPPYVFNITNELKMAARRQGEDVIDLSMGNPDGPTRKSRNGPACSSACVRVAALPSNASDPSTRGQTTYACRPCARPSRTLA